MYEFYARVHLNEYTMVFYPIYAETLKIYNLKDNHVLLTPEITLFVISFSACDWIKLSFCTQQGFLRTRYARA